MGLEDDLKTALEIKGKGVQELAALQQRVANGESLGDPIKDYLFVCFGTTDYPVVEEKLRTLSEMVQAHKGQQIMVLYIQSELVEKGGCFSAPRYDDKVTGQQLGVLDGEVTFNLENGDVVLPTSKYVQKGEESFLFMITEESWRLKGGGIPISGYRYRPGNFMENSTLARREMLFGDEVELYFSTGKMYLGMYLERRSDSLKKDLLEESKIVREEYLAASALLGIEVPSRFKERYETKRQEQKMDILDSVRRKDISPRMLERALSLGLHREQQTFELEPGITMSVPEYLRAQCEKYKIKIPE